MIQRSKYNPILTPSDIKPSNDSLGVTCLLNPGAFRFDGKTWLLVRVAERPAQEEGFVRFPIMDPHTHTIMSMQVALSDKDLDLSDARVISYQGNDYLTTMSHLHLVCSTDGIHFKEDPSYPPLLPCSSYETYGIEDCRVTQIGVTYYLTYTAVSANGVAVGMKSTTDWKVFSNFGLILPPHNKDCTLFDCPINNRYYMLHRPSSPEIGGNYIWLAQSNDLIHWGNHLCVARTRPGQWDSARIGAGCAPIKTPKGWLMIYHGADENNRYCLGAILLDSNDPSIVLARTNEPLLEPEMPYEVNGFFGKVIFTNGQIINGDVVSLYYGAADNVICLATFSISEVLNHILTYIQ